VIRSMTGYGSANLETGALRASVTVRSVNHRFLDVAVHLPRRLSPLEAEAKEQVAAAVARGRVEVSVQAGIPEAGEETMTANRPLVTSLVRTLRDLQNEFGLEGGVTVGDLARFPGVLERLEVATEVPEEVRRAVRDLLGKALAGLDVMRRAEGERLRAELERLVEGLEGAAAQVEARSLESRGSRQEALLERARALRAELGLEDARLYQEVVRAVERHDVAEEVQRLRSHAASVRELLSTDGAPAGKRLDFLAQELMREANTIGSKIADAAAIREVVELKSGIERLREQVQNVE
jgi:uncharacterized protein (TIGR00255 family)